MKTDILISIDIGLTGGIAFFEVEERDHPSGGLLTLQSMPIIQTKAANGKTKNVLDYLQLLFLLERPRLHGDSALVVFEDVHAFPGQGVVSVGSLLEQKGAIRGMSVALGYEVKMVSPKEWQKHFGMIPPKELRGEMVSQTKTLRKKWLKEKSLVYARDYFPEYKEKLTKTAHGLSDALLIGKWCLYV